MLTSGVSILEYSREWGSRHLAGSIGSVLARIGLRNMCQFAAEQVRQRAPTLHGDTMRVYIYWIIHVAPTFDEGLDSGPVDFRLVEDAFVIEGDNLHVRFGRIHSREDAADHMTRLEWEVY